MKILSLLLPALVLTACGYVKVFDGRMEGILTWSESTGYMTEIEVTQTLESCSGELSAKDIDFVEGDSVRSVTQSFVLPVKKGGCSIRWAVNSGGENWISIVNGVATVERPTGSEDAPVTLTAHFLLGQKNQTRSYDIIIRNIHAVIKNGNEENQNDEVPHSDTGSQSTFAAEAVGVCKTALDPSLFTFLGSDSLSAVTQNFSVPTIQGECSVSWTSGDVEWIPSINNTNGLVSVTAQQSISDENVTMTALLTHTASGFTDTKPFVVTIVRLPTDVELSAACADDLTDSGFVFASGDSTSTVTQNFTLPRDQDDCTVSWTSGDTTWLPSISSSTGVATVARQPSSSDQTFNLTANVSKNGAISTKVFPITIVRLPTANETVGVCKTALDISLFTFSGSDSLGAVTQNFSVPTIQGECSVSWSSGNAVWIPIINNTNGLVPVTAQQSISHENVTLTALLTHTASGFTDTKPFVVTIVRLPTDLELSAVCAQNLTTSGFVFASGDSTSTVTQNFTLPLDQNDCTVSWMSGDTNWLPTINIETGVATVARQPSPTNQTFNLTANVSKNGAISTKVFPITIVRLPTADETVGVCKTALDPSLFTFSGSDSLSAVTQNFSVPTIQGACSVSWTSGNAVWIPSINNTNGLVSVTAQQSISHENVTLTALLTHTASGFTDTKPFVVTIVRLPTDLELSAACAQNLNTSGFVFASGDSTSNITQNFTLPLDQNDCTVSWTSGDTTWLPSISSSTGVATVARQQSSTNQTFNLTANVSKNGAISTKVFPITIVRLPTDLELSAACAENLTTSGFVFASGDSTSTVTQNFTLPRDQDNCTVSWTSGDTTWIPSINSSTGVATVARQQSSTNQTFNLTAHVSKNSATTTKVFSITIVRLPTDAEIVAVCKANLTSAGITFVLGDSDVQVTQNFTLPLSQEGCSLSWLSGDTSWLPSINGTTGVATIARQTSLENKTVNLTATISRGSSSDAKIIPVTIVRLLTDGEAVALCKANLSASSLLFASGDSISRVTQNFTLPTSLNDCSVSWTATSSSWITELNDSSGLVTISRYYSALDESVVFTATVRRNTDQGAVDSKDLTVTIARLLGNEEVDACASAVGVGTLSFTSPDTSSGVTKNFTLPSEINVNGAICSLVWEETPDTSYLQINGTAVTVNQPTYSVGNVVATLRATVSGGGAYTKPSGAVNLTVSRLPATDQEKADECRNSFVASNISFSIPDSATAVTKNFTLPETLLISGFSCNFSEWQSDSSAIVLSGTEQRSASVIRPADDEADVTVTLSGTVSFNGTLASSPASASVTVKKYTEAESVAACQAALTTRDFTGINSTTNLTAATVPVTSSAITFPTTKTGVGGKNCTLSWASNKTSYIAISEGVGAVTHEYDATDTYVTLTPTIIRGSASDATKSFSMRVKSFFSAPALKDTVVSRNGSTEGALSINYVASNVSDSSQINYKICLSKVPAEVETISAMDSGVPLCQTSTTAYPLVSFPLVIQVNGQLGETWYANVYSTVQGQADLNSKKILYFMGSAVFQNEQ